jgi:pimeloyl-ACP methyl ester carboxylesterase
MAPTLPGSYGAPPLDLGERSLLEAMADHVEELVDDAGWAEPLAIVGSSYGGVVALELAARGRAATVVALAPPWISRSTIAVYGGLFGLGGAGLRLTTPLHGLAARWARTGGLILHGWPAATAMNAEDLVATLRSAGAFPFLHVARSGFRPPLLPAFDRIECPVTLLWGTSDRLAPQWMSRRWMQAIPQAELSVLPGFPHLPQLRDPDRIGEVILESAGRARAHRSRHRTW